MIFKVVVTKIRTQGKKVFLHGEKWRSGEYERLLRIKNDYYKREESI